MGMPSVDLRIIYVKRTGNLWSDVV